MVGLKILQLYSRKFFFKSIEVFFERHGAIDVNVPFTEKIEIGSVDDVDGRDQESEE